MRLIKKFSQLLSILTDLCLSSVLYFSVLSEGEAYLFVAIFFLVAFSHPVYVSAFFFPDKPTYSKLFFEIWTSIIKHGPHSVTLNSLAFSCSESCFRENSHSLSLNADPLAHLTLTLRA